MKERKEPQVATSAHIIADSDGRPQLQTLRSSQSKAWEALFGRKMNAAQRRGWQKRGFKVVMVFVKNFR